MAKKKTVSISRKPFNPGGADTPEASNQARPDDPTPRLPSSLERVEEKPMPATAGLGPFGRVVYGTVYCLSYSVAFGALLLGQFMPGSRLVGQAIHDGADSARRSFGRA